MRNSCYLILVTLAVLTTSCDKHQTKTERQPTSMSVQTETSNQTVAATSTSESISASTNQPNTFELGLDKAAGAFSISQSAQSSADWTLVAGQYQDAIALMKQVQRDSPYYSIAQNKIAEYQQRLKQAQIKAVPSQVKPTPQPQATQVIVVVPEIVTTPQTVVSPKSSKIIAPVFAREPKKQPQIEEPKTNIFEPESVVINKQIQEEVITVPIKRRIGGTPVIEVKFNSNQFFEMIVDTGASGTVITPKMAEALSVIPVGKAKANTASSKAVTFPIGYVNSMEVGEVKVSQIPVAIAGEELETGLLGHDFFGNYDITIKRDIVEFRPHVPVKTQETQPSIPIYPKLHH
ncbi:MAG: retroviral-like aspartic protease family protein [Calothrix sp. C42_A2020_038]|nr:retroviral-like aspartic protease family protein [Calothrix sp. C42_A2020_038]